MNELHDCYRCLRCFATCRCPMRCWHAAPSCWCPPLGAVAMQRGARYCGRPDRCMLAGLFRGLPGWLEAGWRALHSAEAVPGRVALPRTRLRDQDLDRSGSCPCVPKGTCPQRFAALARADEKEAVPCPSDTYQDRACGACLRRARRPSPNAAPSAPRPLQCPGGPRSRLRNVVAGAMAVRMSRGGTWSMPTHAARQDPVGGRLRASLS